MKIWIGAIGHIRASPFQEAAQTYIKRITWPLTVHEVAHLGHLPPACQKREETLRLMAKIPPKSKLILLSPQGTLRSSQEFANKMNSLRESDHNLACLIGGARGLDETLLNKADDTLAFGPQIWPHLLVRVMLLEQIYRAQEILKGGPYHS